MEWDGSKVCPNAALRGSLSGAPDGSTRSHWRLTTQVGCVTVLFWVFQGVRKVLIAGFVYAESVTLRGSCVGPAEWKNEMQEGDSIAIRTNHLASSLGHTGDFGRYRSRSGIPKLHRGCEVGLALSYFITQNNYSASSPGFGG